MPKTNVLFICGRNRLRSPTAECIFADVAELNVTSAGLNPNAETPVDGDLIAWANVIFVMEPIHKKKLVSKFKLSLKNKKIICLDIPDQYDYMQPELITLLHEKVFRFFGFPR